MGFRDFMNVGNGDLALEFVLMFIHELKRNR